MIALASRHAPSSTHRSSWGGYSDACFGKSKNTIAPTFTPLSLSESLYRIFLTFRFSLHSFSLTDPACPRLVCRLFSFLHVVSFPIQSWPP
jgi:hypothetical protein